MRIVGALRIRRYGYFGCWWLWWCDGIAIGNRIFFRSDGPSVELFRHELKHVEQYSRYRVFGLWSIAVVRFWFVYVWQWISVGFRYSRIPFEIEARAAERG